MVRDPQLILHRNTGPVAPPRVPPDHVYTSCYCEENIYLLAKHFIDNAGSDLTVRVSRPRWDAYVVFISNAEKLVALWNQKARNDVVVWDYHVVLVLRSRTVLSGDGETPENTPQRRMADANSGSAWVYDYDSRLPLPCAAEEYVSGTFPYTTESNKPYTIPEQYVSLFRVIPARDFLEHFASDRSHMLVDGCSDAYIRLPPPYAPIRGSRARELQISSNLMSCYVDMKPPGLPEIGLASQSLQQHEVTMVEAEIEEDGTADVPSGSARTALVRTVKASEVAQPAPAGVYGQAMDMPGFQAWLGIPRLPSPRG